MAVGDEDDMPSLRKSSAGKAFIIKNPRMTGKKGVDWIKQMGKLTFSLHHVYFILNLYKKVEVPWVVSTSTQQAPPTETGSLKSHAGNSLTVSTLRLHLRLSAHHFSPGGSAKVRCVASISTLFWEDGNEIAFGNSKKFTVTTTTTNQHHANLNHYTNERDVIRLESPSTTSTRRNYYDSNNNLTPNPFIFNSTALVTGKGVLCYTVGRLVGVSCD